MSGRSMLFYLLITLLSVGVIQGLIVGFLFFFKKSGEKRANFFFGLLLITFGLTLLHNIFKITNTFEQYPIFSYLPIYFTLSFPTLLFFYVKLDLYPNYKLKGSDVKHFLLPLGQFTFFMMFFFKLFKQEYALERQFYSPFFGAFEQLLYLIFFFMYMYFSYRYILQKKKWARTKTERKKVNYHYLLIQILFILFSIHTIFVLVDFISYDFFNIDLQTINLFAALGVLSFAALVFWLGTYGFQVLVWGRKLFKSTK